MAMDYQVAISMSSATVQSLAGGNDQLYGFIAIQTTQINGAPTVWLNTANVAPSMLISWTDQYQAYTSASSIIANTQIREPFTADINLGQTMSVSTGGIGTVVDGGPGTAISILNQTSTTYTCGINQMQNVNSRPTPVCAFPLFGNDLDVIAPVARVVLMFSSKTLATGTVVYQAFAPGIFIDLTSASQRAVTFDVNAGWSWGGATWAQSLPPSTNLVPLLIEAPGV